MSAAKRADYDFVQAEVTAGRRFILHPGTVVSQRGGDRHYISSARLVELYRVPRRAYWVVESEPRALPYHAGDVHLHPRYDGDYNLAAAIRAADAR